MGDIVNLRLARKRAARKQAEREAAEQRVAHGVSKQARKQEDARRRRADNALDQHRIELGERR